MARQQAQQTYYTQVQQLQRGRRSAAQSAMTADTGPSNSQQLVANGGLGAASGGAGAGPAVLGMPAPGAPPAYSLTVSAHAGIAKAARLGALSVDSGL
jgi:hypothetical protein